MLSSRLLLFSLSLACISLVASAARVQQAAEVGHPAAESSSTSKRLNTYYFDVSKPRVALGSRPTRPERTAVTVTLDKAAVSSFMPVVSPKPSGMTHSVSNTWQALKDLATMFAHTNALNAQQHPDPTTTAPSPGRRLFPKAALAVSAASDNAPTKLNIGSIIAAAESMGQRSTWAEATPSSVLLLPTGASTGAVANLMGVSYDARADSISLELDVVHNPRTISEFEPHGEQTLQVQDAHFHFATAPAIRLDAQALLNSLRQGGDGAGLQGLHVFMKGSNPDVSCVAATLAANATQASVGTTIALSAVLDTSACGGRSQTDPTPTGALRLEAPSPGAASKLAPLKGSTTGGSTSGGGGAKVQQAGGVIVPILIQGYYYWTVDVGVTPNTTTTTRRTHPALRVPPRQPGLDAGEVLLLEANEDSEVGLTIRIDRPGCGAVTLLGADTSPVGGPGFQFFQAPPTVFINCRDSQGPGVSELHLMPHKAYRHVHDPIELTALALGPGGHPAPGVKVSFSVAGDCDPSTDPSTSATTGADGTASVHLVAHKPGAVSVVAATLDAAGAPLLSAPSHLFYFIERHDADEREEAYYGHQHHGREHVPYEDSHARAYAMAAAQGAEQMVVKSA